VSQLLSAGDLTLMRRDCLRLMPGTAILQQRTLTSDGQGGSTEVWASSGTVVCAVAPQTQGTERIRGGRVAAISDWVITLPGTVTGLAAKDRIVVGSDTFEVVFPQAPRSFALNVRVDAVKVL